MRDITQAHLFDFFNPKFGVYYKPGPRSEAYVSFARANREPNRSNFTDADPEAAMPVHETLNNVEVGYHYRTPSMLLGANLYLMHYNDQLVLTGQINDVGSPVMVNVDESYRKGIELLAGFKISRNLNWDANATFSRNKIKDFTEYVENWDTEELDAIHLGMTNISFSPAVIANSSLLFKASDAMNIRLMSSYAGKQYIDNTSSDDRVLDAYLVNNLKMEYQIKSNVFKEVQLNILINNIFNEKYENNAWVYSYMYEGGRHKMDGYFPQAGRHILFGIDLKF